MSTIGTNRIPPNANRGISRLSMMQARLQEQLMVEKESRLLEMAARQDAEREETISRITKSSADSLSSSVSSITGTGQGRVRRLFEERRNNPRAFHQSPKGFDKSYPLDPMKRDGGRPPIKGLMRSDRGASVERAQPPGRSRSQVPPQRANRGDNRQKKPTKTRGLPTHHKSTSALTDDNNIYNGNSRGPSPAPPSSTKSSPGPRLSPPARPARKGKKPDSNHLKVDDQGDDGSRSPTPTPKNARGGGFFAKLGFGGKKEASNPVSPRPKPAAQSRLTVNNRKPTASGASTPARSPRSPVPDDLRRCKICERNFAPDRIEKHEAICKKTKAKAKKRKVYDPAIMRTKGTEAEKFVARGDHLKENKKAKKSNWRKTHEDFINTVRAAKGMKGYEAPPMDTSDYVECPHCGRKFNEGAAERHIPKCTSINSNKASRRQDPPSKAPANRRKR